MSRSPLDVVVSDGGLGSLVAAYLLAAQGRTVGVVARPAEPGATAVSKVAARRVTPVHGVIEAAPVIARRSILILQPEGAISVGVSSDPLQDAGHAIALVDRSTMAGVLTDAIRELGGVVLPAGGAPTIGERGEVAGYAAHDGAVVPARCSIISADEADRLFGMPEITPVPPLSSVESEWAFKLDANLVAARFGVDARSAAEWWLYGDPFDGGGGFGRVRAFRDTMTLGVVLPLATVLDCRVEVADLGRRLRAHPALMPLLDGAVEVATVGWTTAMEPGGVSMVGDGWVVGPKTSPGDVTPLSTELGMAEMLAEAIGDALRATRVTASRLAALPKRQHQLLGAASTIPFGPIDGWADELAVDPVRLVEGARLLAVRFGLAG